jgi:integrase
LIPKLGSVPLQKLSATHLQQYYNNSSLSPSTLSLHHVIINQALKVAMRQERLINHNPAEIVAEKPNGKKTTEMQTWDEIEVKKFLEAAKEKSIQAFTFYSLAIETGVRKGEICGLKWTDINFDKSRISVCRTLNKAGKEPVCGTTKNGKSRAISISPQLVKLLRLHKIEQNKLKLQMGESFDDQGFVFTKNSGKPLQINHLCNEFNQLIDKACIKKIRFHDLRHTAATLMLSNGIHPKIAQERLGHSSIKCCYGVYPPHSKVSFRVRDFLTF